MSQVADRPYFNKRGQPIHIIQLKYSWSMFNILELSELAFYTVRTQLPRSCFSLCAACEAPQLPSHTDGAQLQKRNRKMSTLLDKRKKASRVSTCLLVCSFNTSSKP